jgi:hypothetical protein
MAYGALLISGALLCEHCSSSYKEDLVEVELTLI